MNDVHIDFEIRVLSLVEHTINKLIIKVLHSSIKDCLDTKMPSYQ